MEELPGDTLTLIKELEKLYPDTVQTRELGAYEQGKLHGAIDLIRHLKQLIKGE